MWYRWLGLLGGFPHFFREYCAPRSGLVGHVLSVCEWQSLSCGDSINSDHDKHHQKEGTKNQTILTHKYVTRPFVRKSSV